MSEVGIYLNRGELSLNLREFSRVMTEWTSMTFFYIIVGVCLTFLRSESPSLIVNRGHDSINVTEKIKNIFIPV